MSPAIVPHEHVRASDARRHRGGQGDRTRVGDGAPSDAERRLAELEREVAELRTQRRRDLATARGLGEALQALRTGALALRTENDELRRRLAAHDARRR